MIQAVIFDMDGVLLDSEPLHDETNLEILKSYGIEVDKSVTNPYVGRTSEALWSAMIERFGIPADIDELIDEQWRLTVRALPGSGIQASAGLDELLDYIRDRNILASVASSSRNDFVEAVFDHLGLWPHMEAYTGGREILHGKPDPEIYLLAAKKIGVDPANCLTVEDSTAGVMSSKAAGMFTVGYKNPTSEGQDVSGADRVISSLTEICALLDELNATA
jgi:HAD superfamily hydrolase (TIGR01509 family)